MIHHENDRREALPGAVLMFLRFCLYGILKNLRFFEPFFVLYLLAPPSQGGAGLNYFQIGSLVGYQKLLTGILEIPLGAATDRWGRRSALVLCFGLYTLAFPGYALASRLEGSSLLAMLYLSQSLFGVAEALRTGSHKAIMLDWAAASGEPATRLIGRTRFFSKASAGVAALAGGAVLWLSASFTPLFWAATAPAALGVILMLSYPRGLEGEQHRDRRTRPRWKEGFRRLFAGKRFTALLLVSLLFESQVKLAQHYLQPFLKTDLHRHDLALVGGMGALLVGLYYLVQDFVGGIAASLSSKAETWLQGPDEALRRIYLALTFLSALMAMAFWRQWITLGIVGYLLIAFLQNLRRPVFVARMDTVMDPTQRATTLSLESQGRSWVLALLLPPLGYLADHWGLAATFAAISTILLVAFPLQLASQKNSGN